MQYCLLALALGSIAFFSGCAASAESSASMASISSISASSSGIVASINPDYQDDVSNATAIALNSEESNSDEVLRNVSKVAAEYGISDWETQGATFYAIGKGIRESGASEREAKSLASQVTGSNKDATGLLLEGYRS